MVHVQLTLSNILHRASSSSSKSSSKSSSSASKAQRRAKALQCSSGSPCTHSAIREADTRRGGNLRHHDVFLCKDAVDTVKLLHLTRSDLLSRAKSYGANALVDEQWTCKISRVRHNREDRYRVSIRYSAAIARCQSHTSTSDLRHPVQLHAAKTIDGLMSVLYRSE